MEFIKRICWLLALLMVSCQEIRENDTSTPKGEVSAEVSRLVSDMTLEEKIGQMTQLNIDLISKGELYKLDEPHQLDDKKLRKAIVEYKVGSILNAGGHTYTREHWHEIIGKIQEMATTETRLKIPVIYGIDAIHGVNYTVGATLFPQELAQAATWNPKLVDEAAAITAYECRASGIPWNFSPVLDLGRQVWWSRFFETYGEDVFLARTMGRACIKGYEGSNIGAYDKVAACMKHFLGYSFPWSGRDRTPVYLHERQLREYFLPTFEDAIDQGAHSVMINSGELNGIAVHGDSWVLQDLLRDELGFQGVALTDWEDIIKLQKNHHVAPTLKDAVRMAINAGIDMAMVPNDYDFSDLLKELVLEKEVPMARIDEAVTRILTLKKDLGLFDQPISDYDAYPKFGSAEHAEVAFQAAKESIVMLKNENNVLPLKSGSKIHVTGPAMSSLNLLNGAWTHTWQGVESKYNSAGKLTILEALEAKFGAGFISSTDVGEVGQVKNIKQSANQARGADVIVACLSETPSTEKPGDIDELEISKGQVELIKELSKTGKPIVLVLSLNRPLLIREIEPYVSAILFASLPGDEGGRAFAEVISGEFNPSGHLPFTYPKYPGRILKYDHKYTEKFDSEYGEKAYDPQFDFGAGLSFTEFKYQNIKLSDTLFKPSQAKSLKISVMVENAGQKDGGEVVQLYISDLFASITPSVKRLRGFEKVFLKAGEKKEIVFEIDKNDLAFVGINNEWITEAGEFKVSIDHLSTNFTLVE